MDKKQIEEMIDLAVRQLDYSYAPYSNFHVIVVLISMLFIFARYM